MEHATLLAIQAHATGEYPRECCGLIVHAPTGEQYRQCRNAATTPSEHFILPAEDYAAAEDAGQVVALVHSHPNVSAHASDADKAMCEASGLTWHIISVGQIDGVPECGEVQTIQPSGYVAPLVGRQFAHGVLDCYTLVRDFYAREMGIDLSQYEREDDWWNKGGDLYALERLQTEGFSEIQDDPQRGDMIVMQIRAPVPNHAGVYLGEGQMLHHLADRLSARVPYGGYWADRTVRVVRHKLAAGGVA
ncbi:C40 family peptidase [Xanthomonas floridensis]|uniref:C40 family peptidase n=2 Tax=Xanthomonas floridensis TaxID=1843580 RepID=A0A1A9MB71_9XANT|nr:C40 family peptidase [Xanthomonas floridensis]MEA5123320.1 C40 family peptidase [Xanthomonas floridensis]OAG67773.1 peptidase P60 [Xanthomonas floridensis]